MAKKVAEGRTVYVNGNRYVGGDEVPDADAKAITNPKVWGEDDGAKAAAKKAEAKAEAKADADADTSAAAAAGKAAPPAAGRR